MRTFAGVSLRPPLAFNARPRRLSTPLLTPFNSSRRRPRAALVSEMADVEHRLAYVTHERMQLLALVGAFSNAKEAIVNAAQ